MNTRKYIHIREISKKYYLAVLRQQKIKDITITEIFLG